MAFACYDAYFPFISEVKNSCTFKAKWTWHGVCFIAVNYPPNITTPNQRYALLGEDLQLQLEGEDPEERPFVISMMSGSPPGAKLTNQGVLQWRPQSAVKENFYFKATDECNASSTFEMSVEILTCPCTDKGVCLPDPNHPRGSGMYYCECQPGYEGQSCEREIDECLSNPCVHGRFKFSACYSIPLKFLLFRQQQHFTFFYGSQKSLMEMIITVQYLFPTIYRYDTSQWQKLYFWRKTETKKYRETYVRRALSENALVSA